MGAAASDKEALDGGAAGEAGLAGAEVDAVLELEEAADAVGIDVVGDGGAAELNGVGEDVDKSLAEAGEFGAGEAAGVAAGTDAGVEEALVGVDVADAVEQALVQQRGFNGGAAAPEEGIEIFLRDIKWFFPRAGVRCCNRQRVLLRREHGEAAEAARIDEA